MGKISGKWSVGVINYRKISGDWSVGKRSGNWSGRMVKSTSGWSGVEGWSEGQGDLGDQKGRIIGGKRWSGWSEGQSDRGDQESEHDHDQRGKVIREGGWSEEQGDLGDQRGRMIKGTVLIKKPTCPCPPVPELDNPPPPVPDVANAAKFASNPCKRCQKYT